jgi:hypothetical protein
MAIGLTDEVRKLLKITTIGAIDCNEAQRAKRRKPAKRLKMAARRKIAGRQPSVSSMRPWEARGISRTG